jgi:acetyltransferase EpsM
VFRNIRCMGSASEFPKGVDAFVVAIGNNPIRKKLFEVYSEKYEGALIIHPSASVSTDAMIGKGTVVLAGAVVAQGARVDENCIVNSLSLVDHETTIGAHAHIAQGSIIGSNCVIPALYSTRLGEHVNSYTNLV